ncbi:hypothetical protein CI109_104774 [Kwoniella shandongensis]|uniref:non-specific serine/threonine protein kinase n=1 Tax=Kwoniella shandongensis TaxID=1734106 RepID=A0AAJ8LKF5_9TREE
MSSTLSYSHRHQYLSNLLQEYSVPTLKNTFNVPCSADQIEHIAPVDEVRSVALDSLLARGWSRKGKEVDRDVLQQVDSLRLSQSDFRTIGLLGEGQYGVVDAVACRFNGRVYAMKTMSKAVATRAGPQLSLAIERHIHMLGYHCKGSCPITSLVASFQTEDTVSLVTTYAACGTLWDRLCSLSTDGNTSGTMTENEIGWWATQMVPAIEWLHVRGFVHRDIKPQNFLVHMNGRLLLSDFGSAALLEIPSTGQSRPFVPRHLCALPIGTPDYVAPEVLLVAEELVVEAALDHASDVEAASHPHVVGYDKTVDWWSLGATLFEMSTGGAPFWAESIEQTYQLLIHYKGYLQVPATLTESLGHLLRG